MNQLFLNGLGVIGGADGPTAIFVTMDPSMILWTAVILTVISFGIIFWRRKHHH